MILLKILTIYSVLCIVWLFILVFLPNGWIIKKYPKEWEEEENNELDRKFKEYDENQE